MFVLIIVSVRRHGLFVLIKHKILCVLYVSLAGMFYNTTYYHIDELIL